MLLQSEPQENLMLHWLMTEPSIEFDAKLVWYCLHYPAVKQTSNKPTKKTWVKNIPSPGEAINNKN